jgi:hypothetical protein
MLCLDADNPTMLAKSSTHFLDGSSGNLILSDGDRLVQKDKQRAVEEHKYCFSFNKMISLMNTIFIYISCLLSFTEHDDNLKI